MLVALIYRLVVVLIGLFTARGAKRSLQLEVVVLDSNYGFWSERWDAHAGIRPIGCCSRR